MLALLQFVDQILSILKSLFGRLRQRLHDQLAYRGMDFAVDLGWWDWHLFQDFVPYGVVIIALECFAVGHHLVEDAAPGEEVRTFIERFPAHLLGRKVMQNGGCLARQRRFQQSHPGNSKGKDFHRAVPLHHHLCRLEAVVDDCARPGVIERLANLTTDVQQVPDGETFLARQHGRNAAPLHVLHRRAELSVDFSCPVE